MKKDAYYFSHDSNSQDDPKCMLLIDQLGMEGYGIFWGLIEKLRNEKDFKLPLAIVNSLAKRWGTSKEKVEAVIKNYSLFIVENDLFFSIRLQRSMEEKSEKARLSANYRWNNADAMRPHSERNAVGMRNDANKVKKSKVKESKVNNNIISDKSLTPKSFKNFSEIEFLEDIKKFSEGYDRNLLNNFFSYWKEKSAVGKMKFQLEKTWETKLRLNTWQKNQYKFEKNGTHKIGNGHIEIKQRDKAAEYLLNTGKELFESVAGRTENN